jgi:hypothetical protein
MGVMDKNNMPLPKYSNDKDKVAKNLDKAYREMLDYVVLQLAFNPSNPKAIRQAEIMRQVNMMIKDLNKNMAEDIEKLIKKTFRDGQAYQLLSVGEADTWTDAVKATSFNRIQQGKIKALMSDTYGDILLATNNTSVAIQGVVRDAVRDIAQYHSLQNTNYAQQARELKKGLTKKGLSEKVVKNGFVGIVDRAGRKWDVGTYSEMVIKTKTNQAFMEGIEHEMEEMGFDLAIISDHGASDACANWEGIVISMTGATEGYPTLDDVRATNEIFHPNCEHTVHPIRSLDMLPDSEIDKHHAKMQAIGNYQDRVYRRKG